MLAVVEILTLAAAFFLPWCVAGLGKARRDKETAKARRYIILLVLCVVVLGLAIFAAFEIIKGQ